MGGHDYIPLQSSWLSGHLIIAPNAQYGRDFFVDATNGDSGNDGKSWQTALDSVANGITASNTDIAITANAYKMNNLYVASMTYTEDLTTAPKNCNVIGVGSKTRIQGTHVFATSGQQNFHFWNMQFRDTDGINFTISGNSYGYGWHGCTFENSGTATGAIKAHLAQDMIVENCRFLGNPVFTTAIQISGSHYRSVIKDNLIGATTTGILIDSASVGYGNYIIGNVIGRTMTDPNSSAQMTYGIRSSKGDGHSGFMMINNRIEAGDGISFAHTSGTNETDCCLGNICSQAGTGSSEVLIPAT